MPRMPIAEIRRGIAQFRAKENKSAKGQPVVASIEDVPNTYFLRRPCGIMQLDIDTGGGLPAGGLCYVSGPDNCLSGSTIIHHEVRTKDGVRTTHKWVTLERLYERFHRLVGEGRGRSQVVAEGHTFHAPSMNDDLGIIQNEIVDVVKAGEQECFEIITENGQRIEATAEHKFFNGQTYVRVKELREGDTVFVHLNYFRFMATPDTIISIEAAGPRMTYDLKMREPYHNFIANNFVVHNSGKSYLLAKYIAMNQRLLGEKSAVAIGLSEGAPDHWFWRKAGVRVAIPDEMIEEENKYRKEHGLKVFSKEERLELKAQTGEISILRHATGEKLLETVLNAIETKCYDIVGLDSVSALLSESEATKDLDENPQQAAVATSMTRFFQHYLTNTTGFYGRNDTTVIFTAQARSNRKKSEAAAHFAKYMKDWTTQGAWAARHGKLIDITVWSGGKEKEEVKGENELAGEKNKRRVAVGKDICWEISKGKAGTHDGITGEIGFSYETMTDDLRSIVASGFRYGTIREKDGLITVIRRATGEVIDGMQDLAGVERLIELLKEDFEAELFVRREVLAAAGIRCTYR